MNPNPRGNRDIVELWGREFNIVKTGLSEAQVVLFVNDFAKQQDVLRQRQEHLISLTALAERTVAEADKAAEELKVEARKQGQERAATVVAEAEAAAKAEAARLLSEADIAAEKTAKEIEAMALEDADKLTGELKKKAEDEAKRLVGEAEARGRYIIEQKEAEASAAATAQAEAILAKAREEASTMLAREKKRVQPEIRQFVVGLRSRLLDELEQFRSQLGELQAPEEGEPARPAQVATPVRRGAERRDEFLDLMSGQDGSDSGDPTWEIEIMAPIDIMKIMSIVSQVDNLSGVAKTEIIPRNDRTSIMVYTERGINLLSAIRTFAEVARADEDKNHSGDKTGLRRVIVALSKSNAADKVQAGDDSIPEKGK